MVMVVEENPRENLPSSPLARFPESFDKDLPVCVSVHDQFATIAPRHDVIESVFVFNPKCARHDGKLGVIPKFVNICLLTPKAVVLTPKAVVLTPKAVADPKSCCQIDNWFPDPVSLTPFPKCRHRSPNGQ
jgi:hypothetical protein